MTSPSTVPDGRLLLVVDACNLLWRAFYAVGAAAAVRAFAGRILATIKAVGATHTVVVFDAGGDGGRRRLYPAYKATRRPDPPEAAPLFPAARRAIDAAGLARAEHPDFEADDLIGSYTQAAIRGGFTVLIVSNDKDLGQMCGPAVALYDTAKRERVGPQDVETRWGVPPELLGDLLALAGDSSDNVPGVPGIGPKTAATLIRKHGSLEAVLAAAPSITQPKRRAALVEHAASARLSRELVALRDVPLPVPLEHLALDDRRCHAKGCRVPVAPGVLMCAAHWQLVPKHIRAVVTAAYRPGQETDRRPSAEWRRAADAAVQAVLQRETLSIFDRLQDKAQRELPRDPSARARGDADEARRAEIRKMVSDELARRQQQPQAPAPGQGAGDE